MYVYYIYIYTYIISTSIVISMIIINIIKISIIIIMISPMDHRSPVEAPAGGFPVLVIAAISIELRGIQLRLIQLLTS